MKRYIAAGLAAVLLCGTCAPAYAADVQSGAAEDAAEEEQTGPVRLSFDTLEETVRENNLSIKSYENTIKSAEETDVDDNYQESLADIEIQIWNYQRQISQLDEAIRNLENDDNAAALRKSLEAQRASLQTALARLEASYDDTEDQRDDAEADQPKVIESTRREMQNAANEICVSAENNYISLQTLQYSVNETARSLAQLDRSIAVTEKQVEIGLAGENTLKNLQSQRETLLANQQSLNTQMENLTNTLALQCGYALGTELETEALPAITQEQLDALDYEADLQEALDNSYSIWSKEYAVETASDDYADGVTNNLHAFDAAKIDRDAEIENVTASFRQLYKDIQEKQAALTAAQANLEQAQKTYDVQELQYRLGIISQIEYMNAQDTLAAAEESAASAEIDLFTAYQTYQWARRGVMSSAA